MYIDPNRVNTKINQSESYGSELEQILTELQISYYENGLLQQMFIASKTKESENIKHTQKNMSLENINPVGTVESKHNAKTYRPGKFADFFATFFTIKDNSSQRRKHC